MDTIVKLLKTFIILAVTVGILSLIAMFTHRVVLDFGYAPSSNNNKRKPATERYSIEYDNSRAIPTVKFKEIIGSSANTDKNISYNLDITIEINKESSEKVKSNGKYAVEMLRKTLGEFRMEDVSNQAGKDYMKSQIKKNFQKDFGEGVGEVYFEKFLYQETSK